LHSTTKRKKKKEFILICEITRNKFKGRTPYLNMVEGGMQREEESPEINLMDLEERQRIVKDRLILIGQNLIDFKEKNEEEILEIKKDLEFLKRNVEKIKDFIETISSEFQKFAKKEDLEILKKQAKMFQPLEFATKADLEKLKSKKNIK